MEIVRFDDEVSIDVTDFASRFSICPLTGDRSRVRVAVVHLAADGVVGRHPAAARQLFAVVAGEGSATGGSGGPRRLRAGYAALWEEGEEHGVHSPDGLTAICIEGELEVLAARVTADIEVCDYDPRWPEAFDALRARAWSVLADVAVRIDHVGSTSVPGLAAKPIIDMDVVVASADDVPVAIERLESIGYRWRGDLGVAGRQAFAAPTDDELPRHHLYVVEEDNRAHLDHWLLRDALRADPVARDAYGALKQHNAAHADRDLEVYLAAKAAFVADVLRRAREERGLPPVAYWEPR